MMLGLKYQYACLQTGINNLALREMCFRINACYRGNKGKCGLSTTRCQVEIQRIKYWELLRKKSGLVKKKHFLKDYLAVLSEV